jgi:hypothetical protein
MERASPPTFPIVAHNAGPIDAPTPGIPLPKKAAAARVGGGGRECPYRDIPQDYRISIIFRVWLKPLPDSRPVASRRYR